MILKFDLKEEYIRLLGLKPDEEIAYCVPYDIGDDGNYLKDSYVVVTEERLFVLEEGRLKKEIRLDEVSEILSEPMIACGVLYYTIEADSKDGKKQENILVRFSSKHLSRYAYISSLSQLSDTFLSTNRTYGIRVVVSRANMRALIRSIPA
jgi:hypothetical protein